MIHRSIYSNLQLTLMCHKFSIFTPLMCCLPELILGFFFVLLIPIILRLFRVAAIVAVHEDSQRQQYDEVGVAGLHFGSKKISKISIFIEDLSRNSVFVEPK